MTAWTDREDFRAEVKKNYSKECDTLRKELLEAQAEEANCSRSESNSPAPKSPIKNGVTGG
jgi:hypothetical protein